MTSRLSPVVLLGLFALAFTTVASVANAQEPDREAARAAFGLGVSEYAAGNYEQALAAFQDAHRIAPHPTVRVNLANCYEQLGLPVEALGQFERFLVEADDAPSTQRAEVRAAITRLEASIGEIFLRVSPDGATVTIDAAASVTSPVLEAIKLTAGAHTLRVTRAGFAPYEQRIDIEGGARREVRVDLSAQVGATPLNEDGEPVQGEWSDDTGSPPAGEEETSGGRMRITTPVIIAGSASIALGLTAVILGVTALGAESDFEQAVIDSNDLSLSAAERAEARQRGLDAQDKANRRSITADILGVTAALAGAATVVFLLLSRDQDPDEASARLSPTFARDSAGLRLEGRF